MVAGPFRALIGGQVGEPLHVTAKPVVGPLHHQQVDIACEQHLADKSPPAIELLIVYAGQNA